MSEWIKVDAPNGTDRAFFTAGEILPGKVLVVGGINDMGQYADTRIFDTSTLGWTTVSDPPKTVRFINSGVMMHNGKFLLFGGEASHAIFASIPHDTLVTCAFDPNSNTWSTLAPMPSAFQYYGNGNVKPVVLPNGKVFTCGGFSNDSNVMVDGGGNVTNITTATKHAAMYDPVADSWATLPDMPTPHVGQSMTLLNDGRILVCGGNSQFHIPDEGFPIASAAAEIYNPSTNTWTSAPPMPATYEDMFNGTPTPGGRVNHSAVILPSGRVLVYGGINYATNATSDDQGWVRNSAIVYDPVLNTWTMVPSMNYPRAWSGTFTMSDGRILAASGGTVYYGVAGGPNVVPDTYTSEIYDEVANMWQFDSNNMPVATLNEEKGAGLPINNNINTFGTFSYSGDHQAANLKLADGTLFGAYGFGVDTAFFLGVVLKLP